MGGRASKLFLDWRLAVLLMCSAIDGENPPYLVPASYQHTHKHEHEHGPIGLE